MKIPPWILFVLCTMTALSSTWISRTSAFTFRLGTTKAKDGLAVATSDWTTVRNMAFSGNTSGNESLVLDPLIVCGPSGVGKGTIIERFMASNSHQFGFTTSHTTRLPRQGEIHTVHYNFVTAHDMQQLIQKGSFLEHAQVHGNVYGTSWDSLWQVQHRGLRCLLDIDVQGVKRIKSLQQQQQQSSEATKTFSPKYIFIAPPSLDLLEQRLVGRGTEDEESLRRRTKNAREEVEYGLQQGNFDYVLVNDDLDKACAEFEAAVKAMYGLR